MSVVCEFREFRPMFFVRLKLYGSGFFLKLSFRSNHGGCDVAFRDILFLKLEIYFLFCIMMEGSIPGSSDQSSSAEDGEITESSRKMQSKTKLQNAAKEQTTTPDAPSHGCPRRKRAGENLEKLELESRFSYALNTESRDDAPLSQNSGSDGSNEPCSSGVNSEDRLYVKPKSDFIIKFPERLSDNLVGLHSTVPKRHHCNTFNYANNISRGLSCCLRQVQRDFDLTRMNDMENCARFTVHDNIVTALTFHPKYPTLMAAAVRKRGHIICWNVDKVKREFFIPGICQGEEILAIKFHHEKPGTLYIVSLEHGVMQKNFLGNDSITYFSRNYRRFQRVVTKKYHFTSVDYSVPHKLVLAGDTQGYLHLAHFDGQMIWRKMKCHKKQVANAEFSMRDPYIIVTSSFDRTVKIWDMRMFSDSNGHPTCIHCLEHDNRVISAYFNPLHGASLLTTDQYKELRVYTAPLWNLQTFISHPRYLFKDHPIKAQWHPLFDLVVVGRSPEKDYCPVDEPTIDVHDAHTGERECSVVTPQICYLNAFNSTGDTLASVSGSNIDIRKLQHLHGRIRILSHTFS